MGAVAKNTMSQLMQLRDRPVPELFMEDSVRPMRIMGLKEAQRLSRFVAVLVLVPAGPRTTEVLQHRAEETLRRWRPQRHQSSGILRKCHDAGQGQECRKHLCVR